MALMEVVQDDVEVDGEPVMSEAAARRLTEKIRRAVESLDVLLLEAYEGRAHLALGYTTWERYVKDEFDLSRSEGYRKIDQARVTREVAHATGLSRGREVAVSAKQASYLSGDLSAATREITAAVATGVPVQEAVKEAVKARTGPGGRVIRTTSRESNGHRPTKGDSEREAMAAGAELRARLHGWLDDVKQSVKSAPKPHQEPADIEDLLDELHDWVGTITAITNKDRLDPVYRMLGETYALAKAIGGSGERKRLAEIAGCSLANIDYASNA